MLNHALKYLAMGWSVIPISAKGKEPLIPWKEFQNRKATEAEVRSWFVRNPDANIGIVTGTVSQICVVDLDGPEGIAEAKRLGISSSVVSLTGTGKHLWYQWADVKNAVKLYPGVDVRGEGGYVVAPPSLHPNGRRYRWLGVPNVTKLPTFPSELLNYAAIASPTKKFKEEGWIAKALEEMKDGNIDNTLTAILGRLRRDGYSANDARSFLVPHVTRVGAESGHLEAKIENIWNRYEAKSYVNVARPISADSRNGLVIHSPTNPDSLEQFKQRQMECNTADIGLQTGYPKLDQMCAGGLKSSRLFIVAARTGVGKTNWIISATRTLCQEGRKVLLFSTEMQYHEIWQRYIATLKNPKDFEHHAFYVCDSFAPSLDKVEEAISEVKPDVFIFDHINHVSEEHHELGAFMQGLNLLRRKFDCAGIVTAQLNRSADWVDLKTGEKVTPRMSMIKGSGTIEQASSRVLLLSETRVLPEYVEIVGNLDKNDNGTKGLIHFGLYNNPYIMREL
jgi:hypothetical protein